MKKKLLAMGAFLCMTVAGMAQMPQGAGQRPGGAGQRPQAPQISEEQKAEMIQTRVNEVSEDAGGLDAATQGKVKDLYTQYFDVLSRGKPSLPSTGGGGTAAGGRAGAIPSGGAGGGGGEMGGGGGGGAMMGGGGMRGGMGGGGNSDMLERIRTQIKEYNDAKKAFDNGLKEMMTKDQFKAYQKGDKVREKEREKARANQRPAGMGGGMPGAGAGPGR